LWDVSLILTEILLFSLFAKVAFAASASGIACAYTDISPVYSSLLNSIGNTASAVAGILGPILVSYTTRTWPGVLGWRIAFLLTLLLSCLSTLVWWKYVRAEVVPVLNTPSKV
jgi:MFS family permease